MNFRRIGLPLALSVISLFLLGNVAPLAVQFDRMSKNMSKWTALDIEGTRLLKLAESGKKSFSTFSLKLRRPGMADFDCPQDSEGMRDGRAKYVTDIMLAASDKAALFERISRWGVRAEPLGISRMGKTICTVIGAMEDQSDRAQFWIEKFEYRPARLILPAVKGRDESLDIRLQDWDHPATGGLFPRTVSFVENGKLIERWEITSVNKSSVR